MDKKEIEKQRFKKLFETLEREILEDELLLARVFGVLEE
jgi:hypothetical protein|tara:strand:- start:609 stop:725 length:117 start_codon:yes stop_codon:yes gene_type:complete